MGKDIFGNFRFYCKVASCQCNDFVSQMQKRVAEAETSDNEVAMEYLENEYHSMTCQMKSLVQLTCVCGHRDHDHSKDPQVPGTFLEAEALLMSPIQGIVFRKDSSDPSTSTVVKIRSRVSIAVTARRWQGPSGGLWAQIDAEMEKRAGWVLIEGPGFGVDGAVLVPCDAQESTKPPDSPRSTGSDSVAASQLPPPSQDNLGNRDASCIATEVGLEAAHCTLQKVGSGQSRGPRLHLHQPL